ncbi:MAG: ankyrin repeat domain-containing protein [Pyrinomonadaceae bacterium]
MDPSLVMRASLSLLLITPSVGLAFQAELFVAALESDAAKVRQELAKRSDVNGRDDKGRNPIRIAAEKGFLEVAGTLHAAENIPVLAALSGAAAGTADQARDELSQAVTNGDADAVKALLVKGADPNAKMERGVRPLMLAAAKDSRLGVLEVLLGAKADFRLKDKDGDTALHWAAASGAAKCADALLKAGADRAARNNVNQTPLVAAAVAGRAATLKLLLPENADVNEPVFAFSGNVTLLMLMVGAAGTQGQEKDDPEGVRFLLDRGADPNRSTREGYTALMYAAQAGRLEDVRLLLDRGANPNAVARNKATAILVAKSQNRTATVRLLDSFEMGGKQALLAPTPLSTPGATSISGTTIWKGEPPTPYVVIAENTIEEDSTAQVSEAEADHTGPTELDDLLRLVETRIAPKADELGADAFILRDATTSYHRIVKSTPGLGTAIGLSILAGLAGQSIVVIPGRDVFVQRMHNLSYAAVKFVPLGVSPDEVKRQLEAGRAKRPAIIYLFSAKNSEDDGRTILLDGTPLAKLRWNRFVKVRLEPGPHEIILKKRSMQLGVKDSNPLTLDAAAGGIYYVAVRTRLLGRSILEILDGNTAEKQIQQPIDPKDVLDRAHVVIP